MVGVLTIEMKIHFSFNEEDGDLTLGPSPVEREAWQWL
jgi:hypothetical protein